MTQKPPPPNKRWNKYQLFIRGKNLPASDNGLRTISDWRNEIFFAILTYFTPLSIIALVPGVYMAFLHGIPVVGFVDLLSFVLLILILVNPGLPLQIRKLIFIFIFYLLSIVLIYYLGHVGPGLLFLITITVISSIIYSSAAGYYSAWINTFICFVFGVLNYFNVGIPIVIGYALGAWIAITANLVMLSFACAKCLDLLLAGLSRSLHVNKTSAEKLKKANRLYQFISNVNQSIVHIKDEQTLFRNSCQIAFETGGFRMAWVGKFDEDYKRIILLDQEGIPENDVHLFSASYAAGGPQDYVLRKDSYYVCNDVENDLALKNWKPFALLHGIRSCIVLPIKKEGFIIGTFNLYASELHSFDEEEIKLLQEVTGDISFALDLFEKEAKHERAEEQREFDRNNLDALINNTSDLMWSVDKNYNLITSNQPFDKAILRSGMVIKKGANVLAVASSEEESARFKSNYDRAFAGETFTKFEHGTEYVEYYLEVSFCPIRNGNEVIGCACHSRDITQRKLIEEEREKMITNIVEHSKKLEQFAFIVSHNLRAPVAHIMGLSNVLKGNIPEEERALSQQFLFKATEQLDNVFKDLNKILQLKSEINDYKEQVDFKELVDAIILSNNTLIEKERVQIVTDFSAINKITSIKSYIYSIFYNLISNSIKYRNPGEPPLISIKTEAQKNSVLIVFKDNGLGIDLVKHGENLFGLYKRFHLNSEGKGMGLFMIKTQIEVLGGTIKVKTAPEEGAEFIIELPL